MSLCVNVPPSAISRMVAPSDAPTDGIATVTPFAKSAVFAAVVSASFVPTSMAVDAQFTAPVSVTVPPPVKRSAPDSPVTLSKSSPIVTSKPSVSMTPPFAPT